MADKAYPNGLDTGTLDTMEIQAIWHIHPDDDSLEFIIAKPKGYFDDVPEGGGELDEALFIMEDTTVGELMAVHKFDEHLRAEKNISLSESVKEKVLHPKIKNLWKITAKVKKDKIEKVK